MRTIVKISIIVPAFNEEKLISGSLRAMKEASAAFAECGWAVEFVVCNNNSTDRTGEIAEAEGAIVVFEPINQIGRARNAGARGASGDWLVFVDADSYPSRELFDATAGQIEGGRVAAGGSLVQLDARDIGGRFFVWMWNRISQWRRWMAGSYIFCDAQAFREIGGFSANLYASEELDLSERLKAWAKKRGKSVVILTKHPLLTSGRKMNLYSKWEHLKVLWRIAMSGGRALGDPKACNLWYDGRR